MRALLTILVFSWAIWRTYASGNYLHIRGYLWAVWWTAVLGEGYLFLMGDNATTMFWILYSGGTAAIISYAWLISTRMVLHNPLRAAVLPCAYGAALFNFAWFWPEQLAPGALMGLTQATVLAIAGIQTLCSVPIVFSMNSFVRGEDLPLRTLGRLWLAQALMFYLFTAGGESPAWEQMGKWVPAVVLAAFLLRLGFLFRPQMRCEAQGVLR